MNIPEAEQITLLQAHLTAKGVRTTIPQVGPPSRVFLRLRLVHGASWVLASDLVGSLPTLPPLTELPDAHIAICLQINPTTAHFSVLPAHAEAHGIIRRGTSLAARPRPGAYSRLAAYKSPSANDQQLTSRLADGTVGATQLGLPSQDDVKAGGSAVKSSCGLTLSANLAQPSTEEHELLRRLVDGSFAATVQRELGRARSVNAAQHQTYLQRSWAPGSVAAYKRCTTEKDVSTPRMSAYSLRRLADHGLVLLLARSFSNSAMVSDAEDGVTGPAVSATKKT